MKINEKANSIHKLSQFILLLHRKNPNAIPVIVICIATASILSAGSNYFLGVIVDNLGIEQYFQDTFIHIFLLGVMVFLFRFGALSLNKFVGYFCNKVSEKLAHSLQKDVLVKIEKIKFACFDKTGNRDLIQRMRDNVQGESSQLLASISYTLYGILIILLYSILVSSVLWYASIILLSSSIISIFVSVKFGMDNYFMKRRQSRTERLANYYENLLLDRSSAKEIRAYELFAFLFKRWIGHRQEVMGEELRQLTQFTLVEFLGKIIQAAGYFICLLFCGIAMINNKGVTLGDFVLVLNIGSMFLDDFDTALFQIKKISKFYAFINDVIIFEGLPENLKTSRYYLLMKL